MTWHTELRKHPVAFAAWKAKRAARARARYHAKKNDPSYVEKKRASDRKNFKKRYKKARADSERVEKYRAKQREYYHARGWLIRKINRKNAKQHQQEVGCVGASEHSAHQTNL